jgi:hypothetical protein
VESGSRGVLPSVFLSLTLLSVGRGYDRFAWGGGLTCPRFCLDRAFPGFETRSLACKLFSLVPRIMYCRWFV